MTQQRWLLSVGVNDYGAQVRLPNLHCAVNDACLIHRRLVDEYNFQGVLLAHPRDVASSPLASLSASSAGPGSAEDIIEQIGLLRRRMAPEDLFVFFYAGHGSPQPPGYLIPYGGAHDRPSTHLMYRTLLGELSGLPCRFQVLLLDCCYAGLALRPGGTLTGEAAGGRAVVLAATDARAVTPDRIPGVEDGRYSPFAAAVAEFLLDRVALGATFDAEDLHAYVRNRVRQLMPPDLVAAGALPCYRDEVPEVRPGRAPLLIRRPGLALPGNRHYACGVGERLALENPVRRNGVRGSALEWVVTARNAGFDSGEEEQAGCDLEHLSFEFAGVYDLRLDVGEPDTGEEAAGTITVRVEEARPSALRLSHEPLPVGLAGHSYQAVVGVSGGLPPYSNLEVEGLPPGFRWGWECPTPDRPATGVRLQGSMAEAPGAGSASWSDGDPVMFEVRLRLADAAGARATASKRLLVISSKDYCHIPAGPFQVGYRAQLQKEACIVRMLTDLAASLKNRGAKLPPSVKALVDKVGRGLADDAVRQVLEVNPGAEVELPEYYIRKYPVTNRAWRAYVRANANASPPPYVPAHWDASDHDYFGEAEANLPVVNVPYAAICAYLEWKGTRLPTAWEWERAARDRDGRLFPWGDDFDAARCNTRESGLGHLTPVDHYAGNVSPDGVCDLVGNAAEWVDRRVLRGGWLHQPFRGGSYLDWCLFALTFRDSNESGIRFGADESVGKVGETAFPWLGFRDVLDLDPDPSEGQALVSLPRVRLCRPDGEVWVEPFDMARYAVSNLEYWDFVQATGHRLPETWVAGEGQPFPPRQRHLPVVGVTYRDALAYCLWKSRQLQRVIRLPSAEQWLAAVDGGLGRRFPWGDRFDLQHCNASVSGWGKRLPVCALSAGRSAQGLYNLVGNVCEWVSPFRVCGGSWQDDCEVLSKHAFCQNVRQTTDYGFRRDDVGFRYIAHPQQEPSL